MTRNSVWQFVSVFVIIAMLVGMGVGLVSPAQAASNQISSGKAQVDALVYVALEQKGTTEVLVILKAQADLSGAAHLKTKAEKGQYVYDQLTQVAAKTQGRLKSFLNASKATYRAYWIQNMFKVTVDLNLLQALQVQPDVDRIGIYTPPTPDTVTNGLGAYGSQYGPIPPDSSDFAASSGLAGLGAVYGPFPSGVNTVEWNISRVGADDAWALGYNGTGAVVGDLDTGVQWDHPALINHYRDQIPGAPSRHDYNWYDGGMTIEPVDYATHGTHTMGTIVGDDGGANQIGVAPGAKWIACPGIGSPYVGPFECFEFFLAPTKLDGTDPRPDLAPHVISNSWSSSGTDFHPAIQALYAAGIFFSKSGGNTGSACNTITNPGQWPEVTAAAAFAQGDTIASFSSRGPVYIGLDAFMKPDIAAPGVNVRSSIPTNNYGTMDGTSMACPHVTGAVALIISANPALAGRIDIIQSILKNSAEVKIDAQCTPFVDHPNDVWGWGILNTWAAVTMALSINLGALDGAVIDGSTGLPVPGADISFANTDIPWDYSGNSDDAGNFEHILPAGSYDLTAEKYGYLPGTVLGVQVQAGITVTQNITLNVAPVYTVSGVVQETSTGDPLKATIEFVDTSITVTSDPFTGEYSAQVAEGTYWMRVSNPGHSTVTRQVTVDQNLTEDFSLDAIYNYYMRTFEDLCDLPQFGWRDATAGTPRNLSDDSYVYVALPSGRNFTFYGTTYTALYVGSNGIITFGLANNKWSGPIPNPEAPNNGIYAFSTDLNPANGAQGIVYTDYQDSRYFVIEWHAVQHYPSGDPETFEIILDLDTGQITIQYLVVSNPTDVVAGVENSTGTEATQYAYNDPTRIAEGKAVYFFPAFGTPPLVPVPFDIGGSVTNVISNDPISGAVVEAAEVTGTLQLSYTTGVDGTYTGLICPGTFNMYAHAVNYYPSDVVTVTLPGITTVDFALLASVPMIDITPTEVIVELGQGFSQDVPMTILDTGDVTLTYEIVEAPAVDWLSEQPSSGDVAPMTSTQVTLSLDATSLSEGVYTTTLQVLSNDPTRPQVDVPVTLTIICQPVTSADFIWAPATPVDGEVITFTGSSNGSLPVYTWDFNDGGSGVGEMITHIYAAPGDYTVVMTATSCSAIGVDVTHTLTVGTSCTPVYGGNFTWQPVTPTVGELVSFTATALGTEPFTFDWGFSDGFTTTGVTVEHAFSQVGDYTGTLTITNCAGATQIVSYMITVESMRVFLPLVAKH